LSNVSTVAGESLVLVSAIEGHTAKGVTNDINRTAKNVAANDFLVIFKVFSPKITWKSPLLRELFREK